MCIYIYIRNLTWCTRLVSITLSYMAVCIYYICTIYISILWINALVSNCLPILFKRTRLFTEKPMLISIFSNYLSPDLICVAPCIYRCTYSYNSQSSYRNRHNIGTYYVSIVSIYNIYVVV